jgi:hypothetical protein
MKKIEEIDGRLWYSSQAEPPQKLYYSSISDPQECPKIRIIWLFHPSIVKIVAWFLQKVLGWKRLN